MSRGQVDRFVTEQTAKDLSLRGMAAHPAEAGLLLLVTAMTLGGLAMAVLGLGLQAQKVGAAWGAVATNLILAILLLAAGIGLWWGDAGWIPRAWHAVLMLVMLPVTGFSIVALKQMLDRPPPPDMGVLPPDFITPYSHLHDQPPEVRLAQELADRRRRLEQELAEIERMQREIDEKDPSS